MSEHHSDVHSEALALEKYKYVLAQKQKLNENTFKILGFYQTVCLALASGLYVVHSSAVEAGASAGESSAFYWLLFLLFELVSMLTLFSLAAGWAAWVSYKSDEINIEAAAGKGRISAVRIGNLWSWYETYFIGFVALAAIGAPAALSYLL